MDTTIYENLVIGLNPERLKNNLNLDKEIHHVLNQVDALFVYDLPLKLNTRVGESAKFLSGGEKQKNMYCTCNITEIKNFYF